MKIDTFTATGNRILRCILILLVIMLTTATVQAHVEKGTMPDSVAEMEYRILLEFTPQDKATRSLLGMTLLRQGKHLEAEKEFRLILKDNPENFDALDSLGLVLYKQKRYPEAIQHLQTAITIRPDDIMVHLHLGQTLFIAGETESARETLTTGLNLLGRQASSSSKDQQLAEFKAALATLPKKTVTPGALIRRD